MARTKKDFTGVVELGLAENNPDNQSPVLDKLLQVIPMSGDDFLSGFIDATSDRTADAVPLEKFEEPLAAAAPKADPGEFGKETGYDEAFIRNAEIQRKAGQPLEQIAPPTPIYSEQPGPYTPPAQLDTPPAEPFTPLDMERNNIAAQEVVDWYDVGQQVLSVWAYSYFNDPKNALETEQALYPLISTGKANAGQKAVYEKAREMVLAFTSRKTTFATQVAMSADLKQRTVRLFDKILETRGIKLSPELLLVFLLMTPLVVNGGKILVEKLGFKGGDEMLDKLNTFVNTQEKQYWEKEK